MKYLGSILTSVVFVTAASTANAGVMSFSEDFNSPTTGIGYVGDANLNGFGGGALQLTDTVGAFQTGAAWNTTAYNFQSFSTQFDFIIGPSTGGGADGFTFSVIDAATYDPNTAIGGSGGGLGYLGLNTSFSVEFDTYNNGPSFDPNGNHVGINQNGSISSVVTANPSLSLETSDPNDWHTANITMDMSGLLTLAIDGTSYLSHTLSGYSNDVYFGFTGATGGLVDEHYIDNWSMDIVLVPEPSVVALFGLGLAGLGFARRRRQA